MEVVHLHLQQVQQECMLFVLKLHLLVSIFLKNIQIIITGKLNKILVAGQKYVPALKTSFELHVGVDAEDYDAIAIAEDLTPLEVELRKLEDAAIAVNKHMNYMRQREAAMRDTNGMYS